MMMAATSEGKNSTHLVWPLPLDEISEPEFPWHASDSALGETLSWNDFILVCSNWSLFSVFIAPVFKKNNGISRKSKTLCCSNFIAMKWQCLGIRNHSNYPMIIISKRVYPITIFCGNLFELRAPLHWKIVANTSCDRPKVAKNRAVSEAQGPLLFVVCHSFIVCCHGFLPRFVSSRPGSRVFFHNKKTRWSTSLERRLFFAFSPWKLWTTYGSPPLASTKLVLGAFPPAAAALSCSIRTSLQQADTLHRHMVCLNLNILQTSKTTLCKNGIDGNNSQH